MVEIAWKNLSQKIEVSNSLPKASFVLTHLPVLVMIISVPTSLNCDHRSEFSRSALMLGSFFPGDPLTEDDGSIPIRGTGAGVANGIPGIPAKMAKASLSKTASIVVMQIGLVLVVGMKWAVDNKTGTEKNNCKI